MPDSSRVLGDAVKQAREKAGLTQIQVGNGIGVDSRTILNIENYKGNPKLHILYPLIRFLKIDAREVFFPESKLDTPSLRHLRLLVDNCSEEEATALIPVFQAAIDMLRNRETNEL